MATSKIKGLRKVDYSSYTSYTVGSTVTITKPQVLAGYLGAYNSNGGSIKVDGDNVLLINNANTGYMATFPVWLELYPGQVLTSTGNYTVTTLKLYDII